MGRGLHGMFVHLGVGWLLGQLVGTHRTACPSAGAVLALQQLMTKAGSVICTSFSPLRLMCWCCWVSSWWWFYFFGEMRCFRVVVLLCWYQSRAWRCHGQVQTGSSETVPMEAPPGEISLCHFSWDGPFQTHPLFAW